MPQFPDWERPVAAVTGAAASGGAQLRRAVAGLAGLAWERTAGAIPASVLVLADRTRANLEALPGALGGELRRIVNPLELATRADVEAQTKLARNRVSYVLHEFLEQQRDHDEALLEVMRAELREELQSLAAAIDDDAVAPGAAAFVPDGAGAAAPAGRGRRVVPDDDSDLDDLEDLEDLDGLGFDEELDLSGFEVRRGALDPTDD